MISSRPMFQALVFVCLLGLFSSTAARSEEATDVVGPLPQAPSSASQAPSSTSFASSGNELSDSKWHFYSTGYLWLPGMHGTVGVRGFDASVHLSLSDVFSNARFGAMGVFIPTYNHFSAPVDYIWVRLRDSKAIPFNPGYSVRATVTLSIVTPKVAYLMVNNPKIKIYGTAGPRFWYEGTTLSLVPTIANLNPHKSVDWADFVLGARFSVPLGQKVSVDVLGDGGRAAQLWTIRWLVS